MSPCANTETTKKKRSVCVCVCVRPRGKGGLAILTSRYNQE